MSTDSAMPIVGVLATDVEDTVLCARIIERSGGRLKAIVSPDDLPTDDPLFGLGALVIAGSPEEPSRACDDAQACPETTDGLSSPRAGPFGRRT